MAVGAVETTSPKYFRARFFSFGDTRAGGSAFAFASQLHKLETFLISLHTGVDGPQEQLPRMWVEMKTALLINLGVKSLSSVLRIMVWFMLVSTRN